MYSAEHQGKCKHRSHGGDRISRRHNHITRALLSRHPLLLSVLIRAEIKGLPVLAAPSCCSASGSFGNALPKTSSDAALAPLCQAPAGREEPAAATSLRAPGDTLSPGPARVVPVPPRGLPPPAPPSPHSTPPPQCAGEPAQAGGVRAVHPPTLRCGPASLRPEPPPAPPRPEGAPGGCPAHRREAALGGGSANPAGSRRRGRAPPLLPLFLPPPPAPPAAAAAGLRSASLAPNRVPGPAASPRPPQPRPGGR